MQKRPTDNKQKNTLYINDSLILYCYTLGIKYPIWYINRLLQEVKISMYTEHGTWLLKLNWAILVGYFTNNLK